MEDSKNHACSKLPFWKSLKIKFVPRNGEPLAAMADFVVSWREWRGPRAGWRAKVRVVPSERAALRVRARALRGVGVDANSVRIDLLGIGAQPRDGGA